MMTLPAAELIVMFWSLLVVFKTGAFRVWETLAEPTTCNVWPGVVVPMPTLPEVIPNKTFPVVTFNPPVMLTPPTTVNLLAGLVVPMPTLPELPLTY